MLNDDDLGALIEREIEQSDGWQGSELEKHRKTALDYYYGRAPAKVKANESGVVSTDLADMVNAVLAQLTPMITTDALVTFEADSDADEDQARAETLAVQRKVMDGSRGYIEFQSAIKSAALNRNAFAKVWVEESERVEIRTFRGRTRREIAIVLKVLNEQRGTTAEEEDWEDDEQPRVDEETGESVPVGTSRIKVTRVLLEDRWRAVDPLNVLFQAGADCWDLQRLRFFAEYERPTRSDLLKRGYDPAAVAELKVSSLDARNADDPRGTSDTGDDEAFSTDQERCDVHDCYLLIDQDGDGRSERWRVVVGDKCRVLEKELVQWVPYVAGTLFIQPHKLEGEDLFDRLKQTQDIKTSVYRRWLENMHAATWNRTVVGPGIKRDDWEKARAGAVVKCSGIPAENIWQPEIFDVGVSCSALLDREDKNRTERAGAALDMQSADAQLVGDTLGGIVKQYSVKEALAAMMAHNFCETYVRGVYLLYHQTLRTHADRPVKVRLRDEVIEADPTTWPSRAAVNVTPGLTPGQRTALEQGYSALMQYQFGLIQAGFAGTLVSADDMYATASDFLRAKGVDNPERLVTDPNSNKAKQAAAQQREAQQQQQQQQQNMLELQIELEDKKLQLERYKVDKQAFVDLYEANLKAGVEESGQINEARIARETAERAGPAAPGAVGAGAGEAA